MYQVKNFTDSKNVKKIAQLGGFSVIEYQRDLSVFPDSAMTAYFCSQMNVRKRQLVCEMSNSQVTIQAGLCSGCSATSTATTGIKASAIFWQAIRGKVTGESAINLNIPVPACWFRAYLQAPDFNGCCRLGWISRVRRWAFSGLRLQFEA